MFPFTTLLWAGKWKVIFLLALSSIYVTMSPGGFQISDRSLRSRVYIYLLFQPSRNYQWQSDLNSSIHTSISSLL